MRILAFIEYCAVAVGVLALFAGRHFSLERGVSLGVFLVGAGILLGGLESILTRRMSFRFYDSAQESAGTGALIAGLMLALVGGLAIGAAYALATHTWQATLDALVLRPWPALVPLGALLIGSGLILMIRPNTGTGVASTVLVAVPRTAAGLVLVVAGGAAALAGAWELLDPNMFRRFIRLVQDSDLRVVERWWRAAIAFLR
jgi:hypothetical protein